MMKKIFLAIICIFTVIALTACGNVSDAEVSELRQQVQALEEKVSELENSEIEVTSEQGENEVTSEEATISTSANEQAKEDLIKYLNLQILIQNLLDLGRIM